MDEQTIEAFEKRADESEARLDHLEQRLLSSKGMQCALRCYRDNCRLAATLSHCGSAESSSTTMGQVPVAKLELVKQSLLRAKLEQADSVALCQKVCLLAAAILLYLSSY